jgi:hypothetical protein
MPVVFTVIFVSSHACDTSETDGYFGGGLFPGLLPVQFTADMITAANINSLPFLPIIGYNRVFMSNIQLPEKKAAVWKIVVLCIVSGFLNTAVSHFIGTVWGLPLYLDTLFTVAMFFTAGLIPALGTALLLPLITSIRYIFIMDLQIKEIWGVYPFVTCVIFEVLLVFAFRKKISPLDSAFRKNPSLFNFINMAPLLLLITVLDCIVVSVSGGIIDFCLSAFSVPKAFDPEDSFKLGLLRNNVPVIAAAILSRIPINIVDSIFVIFGGYGVSLLYRKWITTSPEAGQ